MAKRKTVAERRAAEAAARSEHIKATFERLEDLKAQLDEMGRMLEKLGPPNRPN